MILEYYVDYLEVVLVAYCKHCGSKFVPVQNVCTQYGTCVINEFKQSPSLRNNIKNTDSNKNFQRNRRICY
ncbi:hypothetical protein EQ808_08125 [Staphylococcus hominis]|uniref:Uncharacterized protein n=1 Tax=Staphylococcus hominis TaxID=1290 RepID=A0A6N0I281_STAHO|nr:hypothetical protein [Staphylococcus hominis]QKQ28704.1 hypothetical protein FOB69_03635 [Staphylococcus hominis]TBW91588.1 hypothetical protein EQ808_08125 [Staphylococcus hominis]TRL80197.1 hypothetical protein FNL12_06655 [Staphylococcus hominis]